MKTYAFIFLPAVLSAIGPVNASLSSEAFDKATSSGSTYSLPVVSKPTVLLDHQTALKVSNRISTIYLLIGQITKDEEQRLTKVRSTAEPNKEIQFLADKVSELHVLLQPRLFGHEEYAELYAQVIKASKSYIDYKTVHTSNNLFHIVNGWLRLVERLITTQSDENLLTNQYASLSGTQEKTAQSLSQQLEAEEEKIDMLERALAQAKAKKIKLEKQCDAVRSEK
jgi:hypothetical protein